MKTNIDFFKQLFSESFISEYDHSNYIDNIGGQKFFYISLKQVQRHKIKKPNQLFQKVVAIGVYPLYLKQKNI